MLGACRVQILLFRFITKGASEWDLNFGGLGQPRGGSYQARPPINSGLAPSCQSPWAATTALLTVRELFISGFFSQLLQSANALRLIAGAIGAEWLRAFKEYIENPQSMLLWGSLCGPVAPPVSAGCFRIRQGKVREGKGRQGKARKRKFPPTRNRLVVYCFGWWWGQAWLLQVSGLFIPHVSFYE